MSVMASQITSVSIVYSALCTGPNQRKHQSSTSLAFVRGIHRWPVNSLHKGPVTRKMFPFDDVIMPWSLWFPDPWEWVQSLMVLFIGNFKFVPKMQVVSSWWDPFEFQWVYDTGWHDLGIPEWFNWQWVSVGSDNGLVPNRWQAIAWAIVDQLMIPYGTNRL